MRGSENQRAPTRDRARAGATRLATVLSYRPGSVVQPAEGDMR
jgi:hypothetical protein